MSTTETDLAALERELLDWVADWTEDEAPGELDADTDLGDSGLLDSMGLVALISHLEEQTGRSFNFGTFAAGRGTSVRALISHCLA
jgi:acyl carrier protein